jgi:hypothetical protein
MYYEGHRELHDIIFLRRIAVPATHARVSRWAAGIARHMSRMQRGLRPYRVLAALAAALAPLIAVPQTASEGVPKQVELIVDGGWLIASNVRFSRFDELKLAAQEVIIDSRVGNAVIVIATNRRFIGYGVRSGWQDKDRASNEQVERIDAQDYAGLVVTSRRLLNFNGETGVWGEENRPVN